MMAPASIGAAELSAARAELGLTAEEFATQLDLTLERYAACEAGRTRLPKYQAKLVAFQLACARREHALAESGLPPCPWVEQWDREAPSGAESETNLSYLQRREAHAKSCDICEARERFVRERFPDLPHLPVPGGMGILLGAMSWVEARPEWMRPALYGAALLAAMTSLRVVFLVFGAFRQPKLLLWAFGAMTLAALGGAAGGLVYSFIGRPARRVPVVGPYLAGIVAVAGYLGCILGLIALGDRNSGMKGGAMVFAFSVGSILFGLIVGHSLFRPQKIEA
ncbi:MAG TPA: helix-turn-helix transcriptional regulator [Gemmatimonadaceae bacterium]